MLKEERTDPWLEVRREVEACAADAGVLARCRMPRRETDLAMVFLRGAREAVLSLPLRILDRLDDYDLEIIRSSGKSDDERYLLVMAVTQPLQEQQAHMPERRAKLKRRLQREREEG